MSKESLEQRVEQFQCLELPGQPMMMHMGTSYLVNDLWREVQRLQKLLQSAGIDYKGNDRQQAVPAELQ